MFMSGRRRSMIGLLRIIIRLLMFMIGAKMFMIRPGLLAARAARLGFQGRFDRTRPRTPPGGAAAVLCRRRRSLSRGSPLAMRGGPVVFVWSAAGEEAGAIITPSRQRDARRLADSGGMESRHHANRPSIALARHDLAPYPDPDRPGVVRVPIASRKHPGMEAIIDAADLPLVQGRRWNVSPGRAESEK